MANFILQACFLLLLTSPIFFFHPSHAISDNLLTEICSLTVDSNLCSSIFVSDPRTHSSDLYGLASSGINLALTEDVDALNLISSLLENTSPPLHDGINQCGIAYGNAAYRNLKDASEKLLKNDYYNVKKLASGAATVFGVDCGLVLNQYSSDPIISPLVLKNNRLTVIAQVVAIAAKKLSV